MVAASVQGFPGSSSARVILCRNPAKRSGAFSDDVSGTVGPPSFFRTSTGAGKNLSGKRNFQVDLIGPPTMGSEKYEYVGSSTFHLMVPMLSVYLRRIVQQQGDRPILRLTKATLFHAKYL